MDVVGIAGKKGDLGITRRQLKQCEAKLKIWALMIYVFNNTLFSTRSQNISLIRPLTIQDLNLFIAKNPPKELNEYEGID